MNGKQDGEFIRTVHNIAPDTYLVHHVTPEMASVMWRSMSEPQREEFRTAYGDMAEQGFYGELQDAEHVGAIYVGAQLVCLMWTGWRCVPSVGDVADGCVAVDAATVRVKRARTMGCVCSEYAIRNPLGFVKRTRAGRDAFLSFEPKDVSEVFVFIDGTFSQSRNWAIKICDFREYCRFVVNGREVVCHWFKIGGW